MYRTTAKEFQEFALLLEGYLRATARKLSVAPPKNPVAYIAYYAIPSLRPLLGRPDHLGMMPGLDPDIVDSALREGLGYPSVSATETVDPAEGWHGGLLDSARILGRVEKDCGKEIGTLFRSWLAAEQRRDNPSTRKLFVANVATRTVGTDTSALPGLGRLRHDAWWSMPLEDAEAAAFAEEAARIFAADWRAASDRYTDDDHFTDRLLGSRLCGHVEGLAKEPMREMMEVFTDKEGPEFRADRAAVAREFGAAVARMAITSSRLWSGDLQPLLDGLHEHLKVMAARDEPSTRSAP